MQGIRHVRITCAMMPIPYTFIIIIVRYMMLVIRVTLYSASHSIFFGKILLIFYIISEYDS